MFALLERHNAVDIVIDVLRKSIGSAAYRRITCRRMILLNSHGCSTAPPLRKRNPLVQRRRFGHLSYVMDKVPRMTINARGVGAAPHAAISHSRTPAIETNQLLGMAGHAAQFRKAVIGYLRALR